MRIVRATFHLNDADLAALTGAEPKLARIPPAHWRNVYEYSARALDATEWFLRRSAAEELAPGIWRSPTRFVSREIAEQRGIEFVDEANNLFRSREITFLRAEKFEGEGP